MPSRSTPIVAALALLATAVAARPAGAQAGALAPQCQQILVVAADACQKAHDLFAFMAPQLGVAITGGNPVLGATGTLGGPGHFSIGLRANMLRGQLPQTDRVQLSTGAAQRSDFAPESQVLGLPTAEAAIGIFKGIPLGVTNVGGIDALVSAFYVPDVDADEFSISADGGSVKFGYGLRVGLLQETAVLPGVSVSYLRRDLPTVDLVAGLGERDSVRVLGLSTKTSAWRLVAGKRFLIFGLAAGVGQDRYESEARASAYIAPRPIANTNFSVSFDGDVAAPRRTLTRTNLFADLSVNLPVVKIVGEIGRASGGDAAATFNRFGDRSADDAYTYASVGLRFGF